MSVRNKRLLAETQHWWFSVVGISWCLEFLSLLWYWLWDRM